MSTTSKASVTVLSVRPHAHGGLDVMVRYECNHEQQCWFPHAPRRASKQEIRGWVVGSHSHPADYLCSWCVREAEGQS